MPKPLSDKILRWESLHGKQLIKKLRIELKTPRKRPPIFQHTFTFVISTCISDYYILILECRKIDQFTSCLGNLIIFHIHRGPLHRALDLLRWRCGAVDIKKHTMREDLIAPSEIEKTASNTIQIIRAGELGFSAGTTAILLSCL